jgi:hypothetical protein
MGKENFRIEIYGELKDRAAGDRPNKQFPLLGRYKFIVGNFTLYLLYEEGLRRVALAVD